MNLVKWNSFRELEDVSPISAEFKNGMLNMTLPKSVKTERQSVNVQIA